MIKKAFIIALFVTPILAACANFSAEEDQQTKVVEPVIIETSVPEEPEIIQDSGLVALDLSPTPFPPSPSPTATPTTGPYSYYDDFSKNSGDWNYCEECTWVDGSLQMGPYPYDDYGAYARVAVCGECGRYQYFRASVDTQFAEGYEDRAYGLMYFSDNQEIRLVVTNQKEFAVVEFEGDVNRGTILKYEFTDYLVPNGAVNNVEIVVEPSGKKNMATVYFNINGRTLYILDDQLAEPSEITLIVTFHTMAVAFDNFQFDEIMN